MEANESHAAAPVLRGIVIPASLGGFHLELQKRGGRQEL